MPRTVTPVELWHTLLDHAWWIVAFVAVSVAATSIVSFREPNVYQARATVLINAQAPNVTDMKDVQVAVEPMSFLMTQQKVLESRRLAERVIKRLGLQKHPPFNEPGADMPSLYQKAVTVAPTRGTSVMEIVAAHGDRFLVARMVNAHAEEYIRFTLEQRFGVTGEANEWLEKKANELQAKVEKSEAALQQYRVEHSLISSLQTEEALLAKIRAQLDEKGMELARLNERYLEKHPRVIQANTEVEELRRALREKETMVLELRQKSIGYEALKRQADTDRQLHEAILLRMKQTDVTKGSEASNIVILDRATEPRTAWRPRRALSIALSFFLSLFLGSALCLFADRMLETVRTEEDVTEHLGVSFLGVIPRMKNLVGSKALLDLQLDQPLIAESFRTIASLLMLNEEVAGLKSLLITSAIPGEGKSTFALHLAATFANRGAKTLLLEADIRRPTLRKRLGLGEGSGLEGLAEHGGDPSSIIQPSGIENLSVVACGSAVSNPHQFLHSAAVRNFFDHARRGFERILVDAPPVGTISDAIQLGAMCDGVVWVVKFNGVRCRVVRDALNKFLKTRSKVLGAVLNDVDFTKRQTQYYYSYRDAYAPYVTVRDPSEGPPEEKG